MTVILFFSLLCSCYVTHMIKRLELHLPVIIILYQTEFVHLHFVKSCIIVLFLGFKQILRESIYLFIDGRKYCCKWKFVAVYTSKQKTKNWMASQQFQFCNFSLLAVILALKFRIKKRKQKYMKHSVIFNDSKSTKISLLRWFQLITRTSPPSTVRKALNCLPNFQNEGGGAEGGEVDRVSILRGEFLGNRGWPLPGEVQFVHKK